MPPAATPDWPTSGCTGTGWPCAGRLPPTWARWKPVVATRWKRPCAGPGTTRPDNACGMPPNTPATAPPASA